MSALANLLGKNVIKRTVIAIIEKYIKQKAGEKVTQELVERAAQKIAAQTFKRAVFWIGIALLVKDVWDISGEATRITTPLVSGIAIVRSLSHLEAAK